MTVDIEHTGHGITRVVLDDQRRRNALGAETLELLATGLEELADDDETRVVVITGRGPVFCAGGDTSRMGGARPAPLEKKGQLETGVGRIARALSRYEKPTIAALNGPAVGAGMDLALWCDFRLAVDTAFLRAGYVDVGIAPGFGAPWLLTRVVGVPLATELLLTGRKVEAQEARQMGMYMAVVHSIDDLVEQTGDLASVLASKPRHAMRLTKRLIRQADRMQIEDLLDLASSHFGLLQETPDHAEAVAARGERR